MERSSPSNEIAPRKRATYPLESSRFVQANMRIR
jgi:hypothetical protein